MNVCGLFDASGPFFKQISSSVDLFKYSPNTTQLLDMLTSTTPGYGFLSNIFGDAEKDVIVKMAPNVEFLEVVSNNGGDYTISSPNGTLYWETKSTAGIGSLVYRIKITLTKTQLKAAVRDKLTIKTETLKTDMKAISESAVFNYLDAANNPRKESFDIPKARYNRAPRTIIGLQNREPVKDILTVDDLIFNLTGVAYDGLAHPVAVSLKSGVPYEGELTVLYNGLVAAPKEKGDYCVSVFAEETATYQETEIVLGLFPIMPKTNLLSITIAGKKESVTLPGGEQFEFNIYMPTSSNTVTVSATPADPSAVITGLGTYTLHPSNPMTITVTVKVGAASTVYKLNIVRVLGDGNGVISIE